MDNVQKNNRTLWAKLTEGRVKSANVKPSEMILGYLVGPFGALITSAVFTSFLNRFYTDILGLAGNFLTLLPLISTIFVAIGNVLMGIVIDKTKTRMGKARPYLLVSAPLIALSCILIFAVPSNNDLLKIVWVAISYNLFFSVAYPIYFVSHSMMVPLSTRNSRQRGMLSSVTNVAVMGSAGFFAAMVFPMFIYPQLKNQSNWLTCMCIIGGIALFAILLEFAYTKERITQENDSLNIKEEKIPLMTQLKGVITDRYWWLVILYYLLYNFSGGIKNLSMSYYCDYVVGTYQDGITQTVLAAVSGIPMALGIIFITPLSEKFGKKNITVVGLIIAVIGGLLSFIVPDNFWMVAGGVTIKTIGTIPASYVMMAVFADVLDHLQAKNGYRSDGLSLSIYSVIMVSATGITSSLFNALISKAGYVAPSIVNGVTAAVSQNNDVKWVFILCFLGAETIAYAILAILLNFLNVEKNIAQEQGLILERQKQAVIEAGGEWIEPEERERQEQERLDREAEESRIRELKEYCERKGLSFAEKEAEYQRKKAKKR